MDKQKFTFLEALFVAILIFGMGFMLGIWLESYRTNKIDYLYELSEINLLDLKSQEQFVELVNCEDADLEIVNFANKIYEEAQVLDKYDGASRLTESIITKHMKYDLLRASLFISAIKTKKRCNSSFNIVTYIYQYNEPSIEIQSRQRVFSKALLELKKDYPEQDIILIPMAGDNNLISVDLIMTKYNIEELPSIMINEDVKLTEVDELANISQYLE